MIKNHRKTATLTIMPSDETGFDQATLKTVEITSMEVTVGIRHDAAMKAMFDLLYENQIGAGIARRFYKH